MNINHHTRIEEVLGETSHTMPRAGCHPDLHGMGGVNAQPCLTGLMVKFQIQITSSPHLSIVCPCQIDATGAGEDHGQRIAHRGWESVRP